MFNLCCIARRFYTLVCYGTALPLFLRNYYIWSFYLLLLGVVEYINSAFNSASHYYENSVAATSLLLFRLRHKGLLIHT